MVSIVTPDNIINQIVIESKCSKLQVPWGPPIPNHLLRPSDHSTRQCTSKSLCKVCAGKHHSLLHQPDQTAAATSQTPAVTQVPATTFQAPVTSTAPAQASSLAVTILDKTVLVWSCQVLL